MRFLAGHDTIDGTILGKTEGFPIRQKITKDTVSEGFSVTMVLADLIPVVFFWFSAIRAGQRFHGTLFMLGAGVRFLPGTVKVLRKLMVAVSR